jgi:hypothetical protein
MLILCRKDLGNILKVRALSTLFVNSHRLTHLLCRLRILLRYWLQICLGTTANEESDFGSSLCLDWMLKQYVAPFRRF